MIRTFPLGFSNIFWKSESNKLCQRIQRCSFVVSFYFIVFSTRCFRWKLPDADFLSALKFHGKEKGFFVLFRSPSPLAGTFIGLHPPSLTLVSVGEENLLKHQSPLAAMVTDGSVGVFVGVEWDEFSIYLIRSESIKRTTASSQLQWQTLDGWTYEERQTDSQTDSQTDRQSDK